jgi:putative transposase
MFPRRPRAKGYSYVGFARYLLTCCTDRRQPFFKESQTVAETLIAIRQCTTGFQFALVAYCFMPDHLHLVLEGTAECSDLVAFMHGMKQRAGFAFKQRTGRPLWQPSYHDHVLRDEEVLLKVVRYVLDNPVRAGLVTSPRDYPFLGSDVYPLDWLLEAVDP